MSGEFARGRAGIQAAQEASKGGGTFSPYLPNIFWKDDKEEHYILFLNDVDDMPTVEMVQFIEDENGHYQEVIAKTDQYFEEGSDAFEKEWDATIVRRTVGIAVELEPVIEVVKGRKRPTGFEVKTTEYKRKVVDKDGNVTDDEEEVTAPVVGCIVASPNTFYNHVENYDANEAPINETPIKVTRLGKDKHTSYSIQGYDDQPVDLTNLLEYIEGVSYLKDDIEDLLERIDGVEDQEAAGIIGETLLVKKLSELADPDRYDELLEGTTESLDKFGNKKKKAKTSSKGNRTLNRVSERRSRRAEAQAEDDGEPDSEPAPEETEEAPKTRSRSRKASTEEQKGRMSALRQVADEKAAKRKAR